MRYLLLSCLLMSFVWLGCSSEPSPSEKLSPVELQRRSAAPKAKKLVVQAQEVYHNGAYGTALEMLNQAEQLAPGLADLYFIRGLIYFELKRYKEAETAYQQVVALDSTYQGVYFNLGNVAHSTDNIRQALSYYQQEHHLHPSAKVLTSVGAAYEQLDMADSAQIAYKKAVSLNDTTAQPHLQLSQLLESQGSFQKALSHAQKAYQYAPDQLTHAFQLGAAYQRAGQPEQAVKYLTSVTQKHPWHYAAHYQLGQALLRINQTKKGQYHLNKADSLQEGLKQLQMLQNRAEIHPNNPSYWVSYGEALRKFGRVDKALQAYQVATYLDPGNLQLQNNVGTLALVNGDAATAIYRYRAILNQDSTLSQVWFNLGLAYAKTHQKAKARGAWQQTLRYSPGHRKARAYLARIND